MSRRFWVIGAALAIALGSSGCVSCGHKSYALARQHEADCELPGACRNQVYVFLIHGLTPNSTCGLNALRDRLAESGYAKVGVGELAAAPCIEKEIKRIHRCEPDARFVLIGYDFGAASAVYLSRTLSDQCIPVEALVLLNPQACREPSCVNTLLVTSGQTTSSVPFTSRLVVPDVKHHKLPAHPETVAAILGLLTEIASRCDVPVLVPIINESDPYVPALEPHAIRTAGEWDFLSNQSGTPAPIGTRTMSRQVPVVQLPATVRVP